jgi:hypothetical protein
MRYVLMPILVLALGLSGDVSLGSTPLRQVRLSSGISVRLPAGWRILPALTSCSDPKERLAAATFPGSRLGPQHALPRGGTLVLLLEDNVNPASAFARRLGRFHLRGRPTPFEGCCDMPTSPGYEFMFREQGRDFEAIVFGAPGAPSRLLQEATGILNALRVTEER